MASKLQSVMILKMIWAWTIIRTKAGKVLGNGPTLTTLFGWLPIPRKGRNGLPQKSNIQMILKLPRLVQSAHILLPGMKEHRPISGPILKNQQMVIKTLRVLRHSELTALQRKK